MNAQAILALVHSCTPLAEHTGETHMNEGLLAHPYMKAFRASCASDPKEKARAALHPKKGPTCQLVQGLLGPCMARPSAPPYFPG